MSVSEAERARHALDCGHPGRSCFGSFRDNGWHIVMSRLMTDAELAAYSAGVDAAAWDPQAENWDGGRVLTFLLTIAPDASGTLERPYRRTP